MGGPMGPVLYRRFWTHGAQAPHDARLLAIALGSYHPSPLLVRHLNKQTKNRRDFNSHAVTRDYPSSIFARYE